MFVFLQLDENQSHVGAHRENSRSQCVVGGAHSAIYSLVLFYVWQYNHSFILFYYLCCNCGDPKKFLPPYIYCLLMLTRWFQGKKIKLPSIMSRLPLQFKYRRQCSRCLTSSAKTIRKREIQRILTLCSTKGLSRTWKQYGYNKGI